ncbi:MAG: hypothetical protein ACR2GF_02105, partial [Acidimicrobiales bacterium]
MLHEGSRPFGTPGRQLQGVRLLPGVDLGEGVVDRLALPPGQVPGLPQDRSLVGGGRGPSPPQHGNQS